MTERSLDYPRPARVVDSHVHFWDRSADGLEWPMLDVGFRYPLHRFDETGRFAAEEYRTETAGTNVTKVVHVQAAATAWPPVETGWLQGMAEKHGWPDGIIGLCDLTADDAAAVIEAHAEHANFRGVRDLGTGPSLGSEAFDRGARALKDHDARCELTVRWPFFEMAAGAARRNPEVLFVLEHAGSPDERSDAYFAEWSAQLRLVAATDNVVCKISGLAIGDHQWTAASLRRWIVECVDLFGVERCLFGSNWPSTSCLGPGRRWWAVSP